MATLRLPYKALRKAEPTKNNTTLCTFDNIVSGEIFDEEVPVTVLQINNWISGELIQNAMPNLTVDQRELFLTGMK